MSNIKDNLLQLIGKTPLVRLSNIYKDEYGTEIIAKVEYFNPGGSVKDRAAYAMIEAAETSGKLKKDGTIIEPTSGNTGIGMAWIAALKGYKVILTMPETMRINPYRNVLWKYKIHTYVSTAVSPTCSMCSTRR